MRKKISAKEGLAPHLPFPEYIFSSCRPSQFKFQIQGVFEFKCNLNLKESYDIFMCEELYK